MPRDGSGVYSLPPGSTYTANTTIASGKENAVNADLVVDANAARPITAGGTGRTTARLLDGTWRFENTADPTRLLAFDLSGLTAGLTRTQKTPNYNGTLASQALGTAIASATTTDIGAASGSTVHITGTTTITGFGTADAGIEKTVVFDGALTLTHNSTSLILLGGASRTTAAGDTGKFVSEGSGNWRCLSYQNASGFPIYSALELVETRLVTAVANIDFTDMSTFKKYIVDFTNVYPATAGDLQMLISTNNGSSFSASGYQWARNAFTTASTTFVPNGSTSDSKIVVVNGVSNTASEGGVSGQIKFTPNSGGKTKLDWDDFVYSTGAALVKCVGFSIAGSGVNALRFNFSSGNFAASGTIRIYGMRG